MSGQKCHNWCKYILCQYQNEQMKAKGAGNDELHAEIVSCMTDDASVQKWKLNIDISN